jgi:hypothetical protein
MSKSDTDRSLKGVTRSESSNTIIVKMLFACVKWSEFSELFSAVVNNANLSLLASRPNFEFLSQKHKEVVTTV